MKIPVATVEWTTRADDRRSFINSTLYKHGNTTSYLFQIPFYYLLGVNYSPFQIIIFKIKEDISISIVRWDYIHLREIIYDLVLVFGF